MSMVHQMIIGMKKQEKHTHTNKNNNNKKNLKNPVYFVVLRALNEFPVCDLTTITIRGT